MPRVVFWGTYDIGKPRVRILLRGLRENGVDVIECHSDVWSGVEDKTQVVGWGNKAWFLLRWLLSYPTLILRYLGLPSHDVVIVGYLGHLDILILWPFTKLRRVPLVWDAFISLYDTVVGDRKFVSPQHPLALLLYGWEWLACRAADVVLLDTQTHADYFVDQFHIDRARASYVFVGVEPERFLPQKNSQWASTGLSVLFYGQFIPLHGIDTIIAAAQQMAHEAICWTIIGQGQEEKKIRTLLDQDHLSQVQWIPWVPYNELVEWMHKADLCLGIFGDSEKARRVIPNKVFQILSVGKPLVTRDSPAIRELLSPKMLGVYLIPPASPDALVSAVRAFQAQQESLQGMVLHRSIVQQITPTMTGLRLLEIIHEKLKTPHNRKNKVCS
jgi:glycosyltransferase involved in cell wall biosynthesis